jgi:hypothetical protein
MVGSRRRRCTVSIMGLRDDGNVDADGKLASSPTERWAGVAWVIWGVLCTFLVFGLLLNWI